MRDLNTELLELGTLTVGFTLNGEGWTHNLLTAEFTLEENRTSLAFKYGNNAEALDAFTSDVLKEFADATAAAETPPSDVVPLLTTIIAHKLDSLVAQWDSIQSKVVGVTNYEVSAHSDDPHQATISLDKQITEFSYEFKEPQVSLASAFSSIEEETNSKSKNRGPRKNKSGKGRYATPEERARGFLEFEGDRKKYKRVGDVFWFREIINLSSMIFILIVPAAYLWTWSLASLVAFIMQGYCYVQARRKNAVLPQRLERAFYALHLYVWAYFLYLGWLVYGYMNAGAYKLEQLAGVDLWQLALDIFYFNFEFATPMLILIAFVTVGLNNYWTPYRRIRAQWV